MTRRTHNLIGAVFCTATAVLLSVIALTGIGNTPGDGGTLSQDASYEMSDQRG